METLKTKTKNKKKKVYKEKILIMKKKFEKFLKERRLHAAFIRNLDNKGCNGFAAMNKNTRKSAMSLLTSENDRYNFISAAFMWDRTDQGFYLWNTLSIEWFDLCDEAYTQ